MSESIIQSKPIFDRKIFWDVDFDKIDLDTNHKFVIERVIDRGDVPDVRECFRYYGVQLITEVLLNAKFLSLRTTYFASALIDRPLKDFKCYTTRQSNPTLSPY